MKSKLLWLFFPLVVVYLLFLFLPVLRILTFNSFSYLIADSKSGILTSVYYTYLIALGVALIAVLFSLPYSYVMTRKNSIGYKVADSLVEIPIMIPSTVVGVMMLITFAPQMPVGRIIARIIPGYSFTDSLFAIIVTLLFVSSAYSIRVIGVSYRQDILRYEEEAMTLGLSETRSFFLLSVPLLLKPMIRALILSWARAISAVGSLLIVAYYLFPGFIKMAGVFIYNQYISVGLPPAAASSAILIITGVIAMAILRLAGGKNAVVY